jgi:flavin reductase (DIM6/NTAB) family NADH-FMN oxidoreductase RutF
MCIPNVYGGLSAILKKAGDNMDRRALHKITYGLYIVSTAFEGKDSGCIVNTLAQVTSEPARLSVAINKNNFTEQQIEKSGYFAAVALEQNADIKLIGTFGFKSSRDTDKFEGLKIARDANGMPYITEHAAAWYSCRLADKLDIGTHMMLIGEVLDAQVLSEAEPLTYSYYQQVKKGTTPRNAPSYQKPV